MGRPSRTVSRVLAVALWLAVWQLASALVGNDVLLVGPWETLVRLVELLPTAAFWATVWSSFGRVALGFVVAFVGALALGLAASRWAAVERLLAPLLSAMRATPLACMIVLLLLWVGSRRVSAVAAFLATFPALYFAVLEGRAARDPRLGELLCACGVGRWRRLFADGWQQLLPYLVGACRNACGMAWKAGVAAEVIGSPPGTVGERVYQAKLLLLTSDLLAWTVAVVLVSWACERAFVALLEASGRWALALSVRQGRRERGASREGAAPATSAPHGVPCGPEPSGAAPVDLDHVTVGHPGGPVVARDLSLVLPAGSRSAVVGESGRGKTTLLLTVAGLLAPRAGAVRATRPLGLVCQDARLVEAMSAEGNVALAAGMGVAEARDLLCELLPAEALGRPVSGLSGGQRRRVELARALAVPSGLVVLDEPFAALDAAAHGEALAFVGRHLGGRTLLLASHDPADVAALGAHPLDVLLPEGDS